MQKTITIILPIRNEERYINETLNSLIKNISFDENIELLIIDGMSDDNTRVLVNEFIKNNSSIDIYLIDNTFKTVPYAMNIGIEKAKGDIIIRLDAHSIYPKNYINLLVSNLISLNAANVGGIIETIPYNDSLEAISIAAATSNSFGVGNSQFRIVKDGVPFEVDTVPFGCYRKEIFNKIGKYDIELTRNQDDELNARLIQNGYKIYLVPEIKIKYYARDNFTNMFKMFYQYGYFKPLVNIKLGEAATIRQFIPPLFVLFLSVGSVLSFLSIFFLSMFFLGIGFYFVINTLVSYKMSKILDSKILLPYLVKAFFMIHISYGMGYLKGIIDFYFLKKNKSKKIKELDISR